MSLTARIQATLDAVCPTNGFQFDEDAQTITTLAYTADATLEQRTAARAAAAAFDWSDQAQAAWETSQTRVTLADTVAHEPSRLAHALRAVALGVLDALAAANPTLRLPSAEALYAAITQAIVDGRADASPR